METLAKSQGICDLYEPCYDGDEVALMWDLASRNLHVKLDATYVPKALAESCRIRGFTAILLAFQKYTPSALTPQAC